MHFLLTNDVESFSIQANRLDFKTAKNVYEIGLPRLMDLYSKHDISSTFYFTGKMAEFFPEAVELVMAHGHDIGCHGYDHSPQFAFDSMTLNEQIEHLKKGKRVIESVAGKIYDFRAPALRINENTLLALESTGFKTDSSIAPQRFDGPLTFGSKRKLKWLFAQRGPYYPSYDSTIKPGTSTILELPISSLLFSYIGSTMRVSPQTLKVIEKILLYEAKVYKRPVVFLFHPNECLDFEKGVVPERRSTNTVEYMFADLLRNKLKTRNLGLKSIDLLDELIIRAKKRGFEFCTVQAYAKSITKYK